jgi:hypothetical protein
MKNIVVNGSVERLEKYDLCNIFDSVTALDNWHYRDRIQSLSLTARLCENLKSMTVRYLRFFRSLLNIIDNSELSIGWIFSQMGSPFPFQIIEILAKFSVYLNIIFFRFPSHFFGNFFRCSWFLSCDSFQQFWSIYRHFAKKPLENRQIFFVFVLFQRDIDESHYMRQQVVALIFLQVMEDIKVYLLTCLKKFLFEDSYALLLICRFGYKAW